MQNTGEYHRELLGALSEEELRQYGQVALDQAALFDRWFWARVAGLALGLSLACWGIWSGLKSGFGIGTLYWVAPGLLAVYWHYRSVRSRRLWSGHYGVVNDELERRGEGTMDTGSESR